MTYILDLHLYCISIIHSDYLTRLSPRGTSAPITSSYVVKCDDCLLFMSGHKAVAIPSSHKVVDPSSVSSLVFSLRLLDDTTPMGDDLAVRRDHLGSY
jgi:hypothetical protein